MYFKEYYSDYGKFILWMKIVYFLNKIRSHQVSAYHAVLPYILPSNLKSTSKLRVAPHFKYTIIIEVDLWILSFFLLFFRPAYIFFFSSSKVLCRFQVIVWQNIVSTIYLPHLKKTTKTQAEIQNVYSCTVLYVKWHQIFVHNMIWFLT